MHDYWKIGGDGSMVDNNGGCEENIYITQTKIYWDNFGSWDMIFDYAKKTLLKIETLQRDSIQKGVPVKYINKDIAGTKSRSKEAR